MGTLSSRDRTIKKLREEGRSYRVIGSQVGLSYQGVSFVLSKIAPELCGTVRRGKIPVETEIAIIKTYLDGNSIPIKIARILGVNRDTVSNVLDRNGLRIIKANKGKDHWNWKGGIYVDVNGYSLVSAPYHHKSNDKGYVYEHIIVAEAKLGRNLKDGEIVHHIDMDRGNNVPENLHVYPSTNEHLSGHWSINKTIKHLLAQGILSFENGQYIIV